MFSSQLNSKLGKNIIWTIKYKPVSINVFLSLLHLSEFIPIHLQQTLSVWLLWQLLRQMLDEAVF